MKVTGFNHAAFNVDGKLAETIAFVSARSELEAIDVKIFSLGSGDAQVVWFSDPAGNTIELQQDPTLSE
jgi:hypothetical protein